jgi:hypothetical protein
MAYVYNDGGRQRAGYRGETRDCVTRAIAIATGLDYQRVYDDLNEIVRSKPIGKRDRKASARLGLYRKHMDPFMQALGWTWTPTMQIGQGCTVHVREDELPAGRLILRLSRHMAACIDGVIHDTHDPSRGGTRCVYGYWREEDASRS